MQMAGSGIVNSKKQQYAPTPGPNGIAIPPYKGHNYTPGLTGEESKKRGAVELKKAGQQMFKKIDGPVLQ